MEKPPPPRTMIWRSGVRDARGERAVEKIRGGASLRGAFPRRGARDARDARDADWSYFIIIARKCEFFRAPMCAPVEPV
jgi:hypothetical protein